MFAATAGTALGTLPAVAANTTGCGIEQPYKTDTFRDFGSYTIRIRFTLREPP